MQTLAMENIRGDQIKVRKGQLDLNPEVPMAKNDSKAISYYNKNIPSYRWPKKLFNNQNANTNIEDLFFQ